MMKQNINMMPKVHIVGEVQTTNIFEERVNDLAKIPMEKKLLGEFWR